MTQQDNASPPFPGSGLPPPPVLSKPVLPPPSSGFLPPPPTSAQFIVRTSSTTLTPQPSLDFDDDDDDDWDEFQAHEGHEESFSDASNQPVEAEEAEKEIDEPQASFSHPPTSTSTGRKEDLNGNAGADSKLPSTHGAPAQNTEDHVLSRDSFADSSNRTVDKEDKVEDESSVSSLFNSTAFASPSASRVPAETSQPEEDEDEDDMWDTFESAPAIQSVTEDTSTDSQHKPDDDVWDSSLPDGVEISQPELLDESKSSESPGPENVEASTDFKGDLENTAASAEVSHEPDVRRENVEESTDFKGDSESTAVSAEVSHEPGVETENVEESTVLKGDSERSAEVSPGHVDVERDVPEDGNGGDVFEEAVEEETDANPSLHNRAEAQDGNDGDVFEEAAEELDANPSLQGEINNHAEAQEVPSESNLHKQGIDDHGGLVALAGAESEEKPPEN